ncbi:CsgG/HfaB family protein [Methylobacterium sp. CM6257]
MLSRAVTAAALLSVAACAPGSWLNDPLAGAPTVTPPSATGLNLGSLPPPARSIDIAVYNFPDLTGQNKPNDNIAEYSRAVTQGGAAFVVDALRRAGNGTWFRVVERSGLADVLQERQLIRATRTEFSPENAKPLPPVRFAGLIVEGGILAYDANTITGGLGARYLGIGGDVKYRRDEVTVGMRIVSVQTGEVLDSVTVTKTIYSVALDSSTYRYTALNKLLAVDAGITRNEPTQMAVREAIELAVYSTIMEGVKRGLWRFRDPGVGRHLVEEYLLRDTVAPPAEAAAQASPEKVVAAKG